MQPDYNQLLRNLHKDGEAPDAHFYNFFEDSLNQFISTNSNSSEPAARSNEEQPASDGSTNQ